MRRRSEPSFCAQLLGAWREAGKFNRRQNLIEAILSDLPFYRTLASGVRQDKKAAAQPTCVDMCLIISSPAHKRREKPKCRQQKKVLCNISRLFISQLFETWCCLCGGDGAWRMRFYVLRTQKDGKKYSATSKYAFFLSILWSIYGNCT